MSFYFVGRATRPRRGVRTPKRPCLERLEDRTAPALLAEGSSPAERRELLVLDARVPDAGGLLEGLRPGTEVLHLVEGVDPLLQIAQALTGPARATDVHLLSHAAPGVLQLGGTLLGAEDLAGDSQALEELAAELGPGSNLLLYGCSAGAGAAGEALLETLSRATGAGVAASDDPTGAGGDWLLERHSGEVAASGVLAESALSDYRWQLSLVEAWGRDSEGQTQVPAGLGRVLAVAGGYLHSLALKADGSVAAWGDNTFGQTTVPDNLDNVVAVAAGGYHSLALKADGTVVAWGYDNSGQATVPPGLGSVTALAAGTEHSLALKADGTVVAWGDDTFGQSSVPDGLSNVIALAAGGYHSLALKADGTVVAWGYNDDGQSSVPNGLSNVLAVAGGLTHSLALKADGIVVAWGANDQGQSDVPAGLGNVIAIAAADHSLALKADGTVIAWGANSSGQSDIPAGLSEVVALAAGQHHSLAVSAIDLARSVVTISPIILDLGGTATVTLEVRDDQGNRLPHGGALVTFGLAGSGTSSGTFGPVTDHGDGTYTATFTGDMAGTARQITAEVNGEAVTSNRPTVTVNPLATRIDLDAPSVTSPARVLVGVTVRAGFGTPDGSVRLVVNGDAAHPLMGQLSGGVFRFDLGQLPAGVYSLDVRYLGSNNCKPSDASGSLTVAPAPGIPVLSVSAGDGGQGHVKMFNAAGVELGSFLAYPGYLGVVRTASADVTGDGVPDTIAGTAQGSDHIKVLDGRTRTERFSFFSFGGFTGGVDVAGGDIDGDGFADIIVGTGPGAGGHVKAFSGMTGALIRSFFAFEGFGGGVWVGSGDLNGDGLADILATARGASHVKGFDARTGTLLASFLAFGPGAGPIELAGGDVDGDGLGEILVVTGGGQPSAAGVFSAGGVQRLALTPFPGFTGGTSVGAVDLNGDGKVEIVIGAGPGAGPHVKRFDGLSGAELNSFFAFDTGFLGGVIV